MIFLLLWASPCQRALTLHRLRGQIKLMGLRSSAGISTQRDTCCALAPRDLAHFPFGHWAFVQSRGSALPRLQLRATGAVRLSLP